MDIGAYYFDQGLVVSISTNISFETNSTSIPIQISFNDQPVGFTESSFELSNCTISGFESVTNLLYTFNLVPVSDGLLSMNLPEGIIENAQGLGNNEISISFMFDSSAPVPEFLSSLISPTNDPNNIVSLVFNEAVVGTLKLD